MALLNIIKHETRAIASNQIITFQVPPYSKIHDINLRFSNMDGSTIATHAQIASSITNVRLTIGGRDIVNCSAKELQYINTMIKNRVDLRAYNSAGNLELLPFKSVFSDPVARDVFGLGTADVNSIQITITGSGNVSDDTKNITLYTARESVDQALGAYFEIKSFAQNFSGTGEFIVDTLPKDSNMSYMSIIGHQATAANFDKGGVILNNVNLIDPTTDISYLLSLANQRGFDVNIDHLPLIFTDRSITTRVPIQAVRDLRVAFSFKAAPTTFDVLTITGINYPVIS